MTVASLCELLPAQLQLICWLPLGLHQADLHDYLWSICLLTCEAPVPELHYCFSALISFNQTSLRKYLPWTSWLLCVGVVCWWSCFDLSTPLPYYTYMWVPLFMEILLERISSACSAAFLQACLLPLLICSEPYHLAYQHLPSLDSWNPLPLPQNLKTTASLSPI